MDRERRARWIVVAVVVAGVLAVAGMVVTWPRGPAPDLGLGSRDFVDATVTTVRRVECPSVEAPGARTGCRFVSVRLTSGVEAGRRASFSVLDTQFDVPDLHAGDRVVLMDVPTSPEEFRYSWVDFQRRTPLLALAVAFVAVVVGFARWRGARALLGLAASVGVLAVYIVPALVRGSPALVVALSGTTVVAFLALYLAHGLHRATTVALAGTLASLGLIALLSQATAVVARFSGLSDEAVQTLRVTTSSVDLTGLLVAGFVVGALGVLDDVTVTQVSTVQALLRADPAIGRRRLYREATHVGRDHIASTVNTLVLAYAGASLALLLLVAQGSTPVSRLLTGELVAVEVARMLVGSIGLVLSVPVTTALAAAVLQPGDRPGHHHGHAHGSDADDGHEPGPDHSGGPEPGSPVPGPA